MQLVGLEVQNFRCIDKITLDKLERFNVLVGKNNSGKSTIISTIDYLFKIINPILVSSILEKNDFHNRNMDNSVKITGSFILDEKFYLTLFDKLKNEYTQLSAAIVNVERYRHINIYTSSTTLGNDIISYIEKISISDNCPFENKATELMLYHINPMTACEFYNKNSYAKKIQSQLEYLEDVSKASKEEFIRAKSSASEVSRVRLRTPEVVRILRPNERELLKSLENHDEFINTIKDEIDNLNNELFEVSKLETETEFEVFSGRTRKVPEHIKWMLAYIEANFRILRELDDKEPISEKDAEKLLKLKVTRGGTEKLARLQEIVKNLLGVHIDAFQSDSDNNEAEIDIDNFIVEMNGSGIREALRLILDIEFSDKNMILIEEPEIHLHFSLEKALFDYLIKISEEKQVFITTHSTGFVNTCNLSNVYLVKKHVNTTVQQLYDNELEEIVSELGVNVSSLLLAKMFVFVEGPTDEYFIRTYLDSLISNSDVTFIRMKGVGNYKYYANADVLEMLNKRELSTVFLLDSDSRNEGEIKRIIDNHPSYSKIYNISGRCIENLFINADILEEFICTKIKKANVKCQYPTSEEIKIKIDEITENLKYDTIRLFLLWKYMKPIYPESLNSKPKDILSTEIAVNWIKSGIQAANERITSTLNDFESNCDSFIAEIESRWEKEKMLMVSGDLIIDSLCKIYGVRYRKIQEDSELLARISLNKKCYPKGLEELCKYIITQI